MADLIKANQDLNEEWGNQGRTYLRFRLDLEGGGLEDYLPEGSDASILEDSLSKHIHEAYMGVPELLPGRNIAYCLKRLDSPAAISVGFFVGYDGGNLPEAEEIAQDYLRLFGWVIYPAIERSMLGVLNDESVQKFLSRAKITLKGEGSQRRIERKVCSILGLPYKDRKSGGARRIFQFQTFESVPDKLKEYVPKGVQET